VFTPFHKPPYPYPYGRSLDETTTGSGLCQRRHLGLPRFRALLSGRKAPTSCLLHIISTVVITVILELFGLEEGEEDLIP
jgi:hypothetical protein